MTELLALVTGASSGIGESLCGFLAQKGIALIATGRDQRRLENLQQRLISQVSVQIIQADLEKEVDRQKLIAILHEQAPNLIINNAGFGLYGEILTYSLHEQMALVEVNIKAVVELTIEGARSLLSKQKTGIIMNVSSAAAFQLFPQFSLYAASKAFVNHFSQSFDLEMQKYGIRILTVCPGMVETHFRERAGGAIESQDSQGPVMTPQFVAEQIWQQIQEKKPLRIVDWKYYLLTCLSACLPKRWLARRLEMNIQSRLAPRNLIKIEP